MQQKFRKNPEMVDAVQLTQKEAVYTAYGKYANGQPGDWKVFDKDGYTYLYTKSEFEKTFEPITEKVIDVIKRLEEVETAKKVAYRERNILVWFLTHLYESHIYKHPKEDTAWEDDWRTIVCIHLPTGQASWHIHDSEIPQFIHLTPEENHWDGHTPSEKYERLKQIYEKKEE